VHNIKCDMEKAQMTAFKLLAIITSVGNKVQFK